MASATTFGVPKPEHRGLIYWMERVLKEREKVRSSPDVDAVHDLRVAIRRCRSLAAVMEELDPHPSWPEMRKLGRKLFRQLGELRDTQVLEEWVVKLAKPDDPVRIKILALFAAREKDLREAALRAAEKFDDKSWRRLERTLKQRSRLVPLDSPAADCLAIERLDDARELHLQALRTEKPETWHTLRIAVKRFRYTVESLLPGRYSAWGGDLKSIQDSLGDIHDLDVLAETIAHLEGDSLDDSRLAWSERLAAERRTRTESYRERAAGAQGLWHSWRSALPAGPALDNASFARLRVTSRAMDPNLRRSRQVGRLALRLYDGLRRAGFSGFEKGSPRNVFRGAAQLLGIGGSLETNSPHKAARAFLRAMDVPPGWSAAEWDLLAGIVRYQRGAQPKPKQKAFAKLPDEDQKRLLRFSGILRLSRALRKSGVETPRGLRIERSVDAVLIHLAGLRDTEETAPRLASGKYMLESALQCPVLLKALPPAPNVVELPRIPEPEQAAASD